MEWNEGSVSVILLLFLLPVLIVYAVIRIIVGKVKFTANALKKEKEESPVTYVLLEFFMIVCSALITLGVLFLIDFLNSGRGILG
jgi:hypothetical protein